MPEQRYTAVASAASSMSWGLRWPSPSESTPTTDHVDGMNCIGPTARSNSVSPSSAPASVSVMVVVPREPSSGMP